MMLTKYMLHALNDPTVCLPSFPRICVHCTVLPELLSTISTSNKIFIMLEMHSDDSGALFNTSPVVSCYDGIDNGEGFSLSCKSLDKTIISDSDLHFTCTRPSTCNFLNLLPRNIFHLYHIPRPQNFETS